MGLTEAFEEPAFVPYLVAGDPGYEASLAYVEALADAADVIELGLPFSDPIAEGPTIQEAIVRALEGGMSPERYLAFVRELSVETPIVCMTYYNLLYQYGDEPGPRPFVRAAARAGIEGFVVPDLPVEEADPLRAACDEFDLDLIFIVAPTTEGDRLARIRELVSGYVYVQARMGTTGAREDVSDRTAASLARIEDWTVPKAVGFGITTSAHAERIVRAGADGIIVGSALVEIVASDDDRATVVDRVATKAAELKRGALAGRDR